MATAALTRYTPEEYLAMERHAEFRSEYLDGRIIAMTGAEPEHAEIVLNLGSALHPQLRPRGCRVYLNDVRVRVERPSGYLYPDVVTVCAGASFQNTVPRTLLNPGLIIEVLSRSTEAYDRGEKFAAYQQIESLQEYCLIASTRVHVERYVRQGRFWVYSSLSDLDDALELTSVGAAVTLRDIYADVELPGVAADVQAGGGSAGGV